MKSNIVNFPIIPRATAITPSANDDRDPHTIAIEMMKKAITSLKNVREHRCSNTSSNSSGRTLASQSLPRSCTPWRSVGLSRSSSTVAVAEFNVESVMLSRLDLGITLLVLAAIYVMAMALYYSG